MGKTIIVPKNTLDICPTHLVLILPYYTLLKMALL